MQPRTNPVTRSTQSHLPEEEGHGKEPRIVTPTTTTRKKNDLLPEDDERLALSSPRTRSTTTRAVGKE